MDSTMGSEDHTERQLQHFVGEFVRLWEPQLDVRWKPRNYFSNCSDEGPHLSLLPDDLLPSLDRRLYRIRNRLDQEASLSSVTAITEIIRALVILCRNLDNIPFVASCRLVPTSVSLALASLSMSPTDTNLDAKEGESESEDPSCIVAVCRFLEVLYDPYFSWHRPSASIKDAESSKIRYQPALLHVEVIPFIYDCFQNCDVDSKPEVVQALIDVLGAIIKGAQHNASKAICPATVQLVQRALLSQAASQHPSVGRTVLRCQTAMVHALLDARPDQCQMEIGEMMDIHQNTLGLLVVRLGACADAAVRAVRCVARFLCHRRRQSLQTLLVRTGVVDWLIMLLFDAKLNPDEKRSVGAAIVRTVTAVLQGNAPAKESLAACAGYQKLFEALKSLGQPTADIIRSVVAMARDVDIIDDDSDESVAGGSDENLIPNSSAALVRNVEPLTHLIDWLPDIEDQQLQTDAAAAVNQLCSSTLQGKAMCCQRGLLSHVISVVACHQRLHLRTLQQLFKLIQSLGSHSITATEIKLLLRLMRQSSGDSKFPYASYVLHCLSSMSKKDAGCQECHHYFDIQHETEGIIVADVNQWQNPGYGLSVAAWVRLDSIDSSSYGYSRRILFSLSSDKGQSFEAFFLTDSTLVCAVSSKKEFITALVHSVILDDQQWHSICIAFSPSRRLFGQSHLVVYVDGVQRLTVNVRLPPVNETFSSLSIAAPPSYSKSDGSNNSISNSSLPRKLDPRRHGPVGGLAQTVPNYFSLPVALSSLKSAAIGDQTSDPGVRSTPLGTEDSIWGKPICLHGQIGSFALFQEALTAQNARTFHDAGANNISIWSCEDASETTELNSKVAVCLSARAYHNFICTDLSPNRLYNGHTLAPFCTTWNVKDVLSCIGGVQVLFPILETAAYGTSVSGGETHGTQLVDVGLPSPAVEKTVDNEEDWEVLPSSSYADWKLEQNPVSGFLLLLRNVLHRHTYNTLQLLRGSNIAIIGSLMQKVNASMLDVQVLMAVQLLVEFCFDRTPSESEASLLRSALHQSVLFDMRLWVRAPFHVRVGHVQYLANLVREDRRTFRRKYGVQYLLDVVRQHYHNENEGGDAQLSDNELSAADRKTMRLALLDMVRLYLDRDINAGDVAALLGFLWSVRDDQMISEVLDVILAYVESKHVRDQFYLLVLEPRCIETLYALLLEKIFTVPLREKVLRLMVNVLKTDRVYEKSKARLHLHDIGFQGLLCLMQGQESSLMIAHLLADLILAKEHAIWCAGGVLALIFSLAEENLEIKLELSKRLLAWTLSRPHAPQLLTKQVSWQECVARLLVRRPITASSAKGVKPMVPDLLDLDLVDHLVAPALTPMASDASPMSPSKMWGSPAFNASAWVGLSLEHDLKEVAESVQNLVAGAVTGNLTGQLTGNLQNVAEVMADNLQNVAGNVHSAVNSAYSLLRQKTLQVQGSLEELGESTLQRLKRRSQSAQGSGDPDCTPPATPIVTPATPSEPDSSTQRVKSPYNKYLVAAVEVAVDALSIDTSDDEISRRKLRGDSLLSAASSSPSSPRVTPARSLSECGPQESVDLETYALISEVPGQWSGLVLEPATDPEDDLVGTVLGLLLALMWRGVDDWRQRSQVLSCINLLGLNNELYRSHLEIKRRLIEMMLQAATADLRSNIVNVNATTGTANGQHVIRWVYDLVVLDPHEDEAKKMSMRLLELTLALLDALNIFVEDESATRKTTEVYHMALALLVSFASSSSAELCAMAAARLHALVQFSSEADVDQCAYLLYQINLAIGKLHGADAEDEDRFACLVPIVKAVLEKVGRSLRLETSVPMLSHPQPSASLFHHFCVIKDNEAWRTWIDLQVRPRSDKVRSEHLQYLPETMNRCWAESDEAAMLAVHRRNRQVNESKLQFQMQILDAFRSRQSDEQQRYNGLLGLQRGHSLLTRKKWRQLKQFLTGPRGAWAHRVSVDPKWKLSPCENRSRMRLKLVPNPHFDPHIHASRLRDNTGSATEVHSPDSLNSLLPSSVANRALHRVVDVQEPEDSLTEEDLALAASLEKEELIEGMEKIVISEDCDLVTLMSVVKGRLEVTRATVCFWDAGLGDSEGERVDFKWSLSQLQEVHLRRYNLRRSALEFFLTDQTNYFLNFTTKTRNRVYSRILSLRPPNLLYHSSRSPADVLRSSGLTQRWVQREISNFDYLMQLNTIAGRTYNDLSQYPVFPWILADYQSSVLDLDKPSTFRDLSRPIGVVNPKNSKEVQSKYEHFEDPSGTIAKFHYGTHYSNAAGVLHYLVRMEPFTSLHIELQSGRFDVADRQFHSIGSTWRLLMDNPNDVKELIPEFFYLPEFLVNMNRLDLGVLQGTKERVDHVELPPWAKSPHDFIHQHRRALESDYVSAHLHEWIDLIFGYKQRGPAAVEALNVFYYCSYEGAVDLDAITDPVERQAVEGMINHFGQTPCQLFREAHPMRLPPLDALAKSRLPSSFLSRIDHVGLSPVHTAELCTESRDWVVALAFQRFDSLRGGRADVLVSVSRFGCVGLHPWASHDKNAPNGFSLERDSTVGTRHRRRLNDVLHPSVQLNSRLVAVSADCKWLFVAGQLDNGVRVYSLPRLRLLSSFQQHIDIVTCLALDDGGSLLMSGSRDTTCIVWDVSPLASASAPSLKAVQVLYGHDKSVSCVALSMGLDMAVSGSLDGTVNVHTIKEGQYIRTLQPPNAGVEPVITRLVLSSQGHVVFSVEEKENHSLHSYSINGEEVGRSFSPFAFTALTTAGDHVVTGDANGDVTLRPVLGLQPRHTLSLRAKVDSLVATPRNTHLLVALRDAKVVVTAPDPSPS